MKTKNRWIVNSAAVAVLLCSSIYLFYSCSKKATDYRSFLNDEEKLYPGAVSGAFAHQGDGRVMLSWSPSTDPSVTKYVVYWNNNNDSVIVNATSHNPQDTVSIIIDNLDEYTYSFNLISYDADGNRSITQSINNARVYGSVYKASLRNITPVETIQNGDGSVSVRFNPPADTILVDTKVRYKDVNNDEKTVTLSGSSSLIGLPGYKLGEKVLFQSSYIPNRYAIDTFSTTYVDTFPMLLQCDKSLFRELTLDKDAGVYESGTGVSRLWDGSTSPKGWPNIYHSAGADLPLALSFDMGAVYNNLSIMELIGRDCCHNPTHFEIWGIDEVPPGFTTAHPTQDVEGWKQDMQSAGWTLLGDFTRASDGDAKDPIKFSLAQNPPPVRYIRMRVLSVASNSTNSVNMTQVTFWNKY